MSLPPHFIDEKKKEVVFHLKGTFPVQLAIPTWMKSFPKGFKGVTCRCEETFYKLRAKVQEKGESNGDFIKGERRQT